MLLLHSQILDRIAHSLVDLPRQGRRSVPPRRLLPQQVHINLIFHDRANPLRLREHMLISGEKIRILRVVNCSVLNAADGSSGRSHIEHARAMCHKFAFLILNRQFRNHHLRSAH